MTECKKYCDRCGKETCDYYFHKFHLVREKYFLTRHLSIDSLDLCQKCHDELVEWMRGGADGQTPNL